MCDNHYIMFEVCFMCYWEFQSGRVIITGQQYNFQDNVFCDNFYFTLILHNTANHNNTAEPRTIKPIYSQEQYSSQH